MKNSEPCPTGLSTKGQDGSSVRGFLGQSAPGYGLRIRNSTQKGTPTLCIREIKVVPLRHLGGWRMGNEQSYQPGFHINKTRKDLLLPMGGGSAVAAAGQAGSDSAIWRETLLSWPF